MRVSLPATFVVMMLMTGFVRPAAATPIVDTGAGVAPMWALDPQQFLAAEFTVAQAWTITEVQGWIGPIQAGSVTFRLYSDGGDLPGVSLFSQSLAIPGNGATTWYGPSGLNWLIGPGSYWLSFEPTTFIGDMPGTSPSQLLNEAFTDEDQGGIWVAQDILGLGVRIFANEAADATVPEPTSMVLLGSGLIAAGARRWRTRRKAA